MLRRFVLSGEYEISVQWVDANCTRLVFTPWKSMGLFWLKNNLLPILYYILLVVSYSTCTLLSILRILSLLCQHRPLYVSYALYFFSYVLEIHQNHCVLSRLVRSCAIASRILLIYSSFVSCYRGVLSPTCKRIWMFICYASHTVLMCVESGS